MRDAIRHRLASADEELLEAISGDLTSLQTFQAHWAALLTDVSTAIDSNTLDEETLVLANATAARITLLAERFLDMESEFKCLSSALDSELNGLLQQSSTSENVNPPTAPSETEVISCPTAPFVRRCYKWLISNIHNPYPSKEVKESISETCNASISSVETWFQNARRRMGWTRLSKLYFNNCRSDIVQAATRILLEDVDHFPADTHLTHEFLEMKARAQGLCSRFFKKSKMAAELDVAVKDVSEPVGRDSNKKESNRGCAKERRAHLPREHGLEIADKRTRNMLGRDSTYPLPRLLTALSRTPSLTFSTSSESEGGDETEVSVDLHNYDATAAAVGCKRRVDRDDDGSLVQDDSLRREPQKKRRRSNSTTSQEVSEDHASLPLSGGLDAALLPSRHPDEILSTLPRGRKRRLSDTDVSRPSKHPRGVAPRSHAVSDPLPTVDIDFDDLAATWDWVNVFDPTSSALTFGGLENAAELDIRLYKSWPAIDDGVVESLSPKGVPPLGHSSEVPGVVSTRAGSRSSVPFPFPQQISDDLDISSMAMPELFLDPADETYSTGDPFMCSTSISQYLEEGGLIHNSHHPECSQRTFDTRALPDMDITRFPPANVCPESQPSLHELGDRHSVARLHQALSQPASFSLQNQEAVLLTLDQQTKLQQYFALKDAAAQIEQELTIVA